jgi:hypothetical protein
MTDKITKVIVFISLIVSLLAVAISVSNSPKALSNVGAAGGMLIENYLPYVMYNDGIKSEKGIVLSGANGDITTGDDLTVTDDTTLGSGSTVIDKVYHGTCTLTSDSSITATTTGTGTCTTTGSLAGDRVFVELSTTTTKMSAQYVLAGVVAGTDSTTIRIVNLTGTDGTPGALSGWGSSTKYWIVR